MRLANCTPPSSGSRAIPFALSKGGARPWRAAGGHGPGPVRINRGYRHTPSESSCAAAGIECEGGLHSNVHLRAGHHCRPEVHHADRHRHQCGAGGAEVDGHDRRLVQHARVLPRRPGPRSARGPGGLPGLLAWALLSGSALARLLALASQAAGLLAERWFFFAQARNPQNIYYQSVS